MEHEEVGEVGEVWRSGPLSGAVRSSAPNFEVNCGSSGDESAQDSNLLVAQWRANEVENADMEL